MAYDSYDHGVYTQRYFCASNSSVGELITLDGDLQSMIMNYHETITEFASCGVGFSAVMVADDKLFIHVAVVCVVCVCFFGE